MTGKDKQLVFIDDSGDTGFKIGKGSTRFFIIACVFFDDMFIANETELIMNKIKQELHFNKYQEYKFSKTNKKFVIKVLKSVKDFNFYIRAITVDKTLIRSAELKNNKNSFYNPDLITYGSD